MQHATHIDQPQKAFLPLQKTLWVAHPLQFHRKGWGRGWHRTSSPAWYAGAVFNLRICLSALTLLLALCGCHSAAPTAATPQQRAQALAEQHAQQEMDREQMERVPPPSKNLYMAVHSFESWENPYITVQANMLELHVTLADANTTPMGAGGMLRPIGARRQVLDISMDKLGEAMTAVPQGSWPYGRVIAIEEAHNTPAAAEPAVRRNMELALRNLSDLGIEVYDLSEGSLR
jgi:hypothetical protein